MFYKNADVEKKEVNSKHGIEKNKPRKITPKNSVFENSSWALDKV